MGEVDNKAMDFLGVREQYKLAFHRWDNMQKRLCELLHCDFPGLEQALLEARAKRRYDALIGEYACLSFELDKASDAWDIAQQHIARRTAAATAQLNRDLANIDC